MENKILDAAGFDVWQAQYEADVAACEANEDYPFAGYTDLQQQIFDIVHAREGVSVLDLGCGTGKMAARLLEAGHPVTAADFSDNMLAAAQKGFIGATDMADYLVKKGIPFRSAYKISGEIVARCIREDKVLETLSIDTYKEYSELFKEDPDVTLCDSPYCTFCNRYRHKK